MKLNMCMKIIIKFLAKIIYKITKIKFVKLNIKINKVQLKKLIYSYLCLIKLKTKFIRNLII